MHGYAHFPMGEIYMHVGYDYLKENIDECKKLTAKLIIPWNLVGQAHNEHFEKTVNIFSHELEAFSLQEGIFLKNNI